ncbi:MAG: FAD:protein FMN transferase [Enterococcus sp.]
MKQQLSLALMGTTIDILVYADAPQHYLNLAKRRLYAYNELFSANQATSDLMTVNQYAGIKAVTVKEEIISLVRLGKEHSVAPNSFLNIALGPLIQTWRIGFSDAKKPSEEEISQKLMKCDPNKIIINEAQRSIFLQEEGMYIDLGALAKGYIADLLATELEQSGATSGLINMGGTIRTFGLSERKDQKWYISIKNPHTQQKKLPQILKIRAESVVTSGIYERTLTIDGQTFHHIFNPTTGYPVVSDVESLTIISPNSVDGEIWTTRLFGLASQEIINVLESVAGLEGLVLTKSNEVFTTTGVTNYL